MSRSRTRGQSNRKASQTMSGNKDTDSRSRALHPVGTDRLAHALSTRGWAIALIALVMVVALQLGALDWYASDRLINTDGSSERIPNTFASIDHPFHISKERTVLDALREREFPRWFSNHQAGYPAEFYPLGADLVIAAAWGLGLGLIPIEVIHKLVAIAVLFIPVASYWVIARRDDWPASVAVTAAVLHLFVPGSWLGGGPDELLRMGMWPNVFAAYLTLPFMLWAADYLGRGSRLPLVLATCVASLAIFTNPRAAIAVATVLLAVGIAMLIDRSRSQLRFESTNHIDPVTLGQRALSLGVMTFLMTATLIVPLRMHQDRYEFTRFVEFSSIGKVWEYFSGAIPIEITIVALIGAVISVRADRYYTRILALWLPIAAIVSVVAGGLLRDLPVLAQLEGPRLLPLVRLPALFLAAIAIHTGVQYLLKKPMNAGSRFANILAVAIVVTCVLTPLTTISATERGLPELETTDQPAYTAIARSAQQYEQLATPLDRPLIVGSPLSEHASFWIPALTDSNAFHAAWIWYWRTPEYADRTQLISLDSALELEFLRRHALTIVLVATNDAESLQLALSRPHLSLVDPGESGGYAIFRVDDPGPSVRGPVSVTNGEVTALEVSREHLTAEVAAPQETEVRIAMNEYPAWQATVDGVEAPIRKSEDGYMLVNIPAGEVVLELRYTIEPGVWVGRALTIVGALVLAGIVVAPLLRRRLAHGLRSNSCTIRPRKGRHGTRP